MRRHFRATVVDIGYEVHYWRPEDDWGLSRRGSGEYRSAVPAVIADVELSLPASLAAEIEEATSDLVRFDSYARETLGATSPTLGPMSSILL